MLIRRFKSLRLQLTNSLREVQSLLRFLNFKNYGVVSLVLFFPPHKMITESRKGKSFQPEGNFPIIGHLNTTTIKLAKWNVKCVK